LGSRERVADYLKDAGVAAEVREFDESTRSSALAAKALGCSIAEIAKSVVFVGEKAIVVIISGDKRVSVAKLGSLTGGDVRVADAEEVREWTGYPIGGVPPFPHKEGVVVFPDVSLTRFDHVWAAAGAPNTVFRIRTNSLISLLGDAPRDLSG
jgi:prolyl-tRNA editing enzyme YbaK/EbsC (Cys-tRNA(Pro) deacylase)